MCGKCISHAGMLSRHAPSGDDNGDALKIVWSYSRDMWSVRGRRTIVGRDCVYIQHVGRDGDSV